MLVESDKLEPGVHVSVYGESAGVTIGDINIGKVIQKVVSFSGIETCGCSTL